MYAGMTQKMPCLLLLESDVASRGPLVEQIAEQTGWEVLPAGGFEEALSLAEGREIDLILAGREEKGEGGRIGLALRRAGIGKALVLLAPSLGGVASLQEGPQDGVDAVVIRPFRLGALLTTLRTILRDCLARGRRSLEAAPLIGGWRFLAEARVLECPGRPGVRLTEKEAAILAFLHRAGGRVVGRDELLSAVWGHHSRLTTHTIETHVYRLRRKLGVGDGSPGPLRTEPGGYRLVP